MDFQHLWICQSESESATCQGGDVDRYMKFRTYTRRARCQGFPDNFPELPLKSRGFKPGSTNPNVPTGMVFDCTCLTLSYFPEISPYLGNRCQRRLTVNFLGIPSKNSSIRAPINPELNSRCAAKLVGNGAGSVFTRQCLTECRPRVFTDKQGNIRRPLPPSSASTAAHFVSGHRREAVQGCP